MSTRIPLCAASGFKASILRSRGESFNHWQSFNWQRIMRSNCNSHQPQHSPMRWRRSPTTMVVETLKSSSARLPFHSVSHPKRRSCARGEQLATRKGTAAWNYRCEKLFSMFFSFVLTGRARRLLIPYDIIFLRPSVIINLHSWLPFRVTSSPENKNCIVKRTGKALECGTCVCEKSAHTHKLTSKP